MEVEAKVGNQIDVRDSLRNWRVATIVEMKMLRNNSSDDVGNTATGETQILIQYNNCLEKSDEWIMKSSKRLAPYRSMTLGNATHTLEFLKKSMMFILILHNSECGSAPKMCRI
jgi:hypothetical protein